MTDLATLGIRVEGQEVVTADQQLDGLAASAAKAETATERLAAAARGNGAAMMTMNTAMRQQERANYAVRGAMGLTAAEGLNLSRQFADIGVTAAMGMNPLMIALQQGPQLMDIFQTAATRSGATIVSVMRGVATATWAALAPLMAILAPIGIAVAALAAGWALASRSITTSIGDVAKEMNLTEEQLERLKEKNIATTATMGDAWNGLGTTIKEMFQSVFGEQLSWVSNQWNSFLDDLTANTGKEVDAIAGFFTGAYNVVRDTWKMLPRALGDAAVTSVNAMIGAINGLVERSVAGINRLRASYNSLPAWMRGGQAAPMMSAPQIGAVGNPYAGGMSAAADAARGSFSAGYNSRQGMSGRFMDTWRQNTLESAQARITAGAGDPASEAADKARKAAEEIQRLIKTGDASLTPLRGLFIDMITPLEQMATELRLIDGLANDMADGLTSAFGESGRALGDLMTTMTAYQSKLAEIDMAEREYRLTAMQADRERSQAQMQNYGDMAAAARGFFAEGSDGYKVLLAIEQAYRIQQMIGMVQAMAMGSTETASSVANSATKGAASMAAGAAKMFEALGPWAFPAVAAMVAVLASFGLRGGSGGGSRGASGAAANDNTPADTTAAVRAQSERQGQAQAAAAQSMANRVQVVVTADREGLNAYVVGTAERVAAPMAVQSGQVSAQVAQNRTETAATRRAQYTVRS